MDEGIIKFLKIAVKTNADSITIKKEDAKELLKLNKEKEHMKELYKKEYERLRELNKQNKEKLFKLKALYFLKEYREDLLDDIETLEENGREKAVLYNYKKVGAINSIISEISKELLGVEDENRNTTKATKL